MHTINFSDDFYYIFTSFIAELNLSSTCSVARESSSLTTVLTDLHRMSYN